MNDERQLSAQRLHWEIESLVRQGMTGRSIQARHRVLAGIYRSRAEDLIPQGDLSAWPDVFAAITHYGEAGHSRDAHLMVEWAREQCSTLSDHEGILEELSQIESWLLSLKVPPSLSAFARVLPPPPEIAA
jgi:hypothetical protein